MDDTGNQGIPLEKAMIGILALLADEREARIAGDDDAQKTEVLLANAGLSAKEIASLVNKNYEAVRSTLKRSRAG